MRPLNTSFIVLPKPKPKPGLSTHARFRCSRWRLPRIGATRLGLSVGALLMLSTHAACAAALGSLATSVGPLAAVAALFVIKAWPAHLPASALSTASAALLIAGGVTWLWRTRTFARGAPRAQRRGRRAAGRERVGVETKATIDIVLPAGFEHDTLLADLRRQFVLLQQAWDRVEMTALRTLTTPEMLDELCLELPHATGRENANCTEVVALHAELLGFEALAQVFVASVEFSGLIRESAHTRAAPFREVWLLTLSRQDAGVWRLARHQALI